MADPTVSATTPKFPPAHAEDDVNLRPAGEAPWYLEAAHGEDDVNLHSVGEKPWYVENGDSFISETPAMATQPSTPTAAPTWYQRVCAWFGE